MANSKGYGAPTFPADIRAKQAEVLTVKEQRFIEEYLVDTDQKNAAIRAGYSRKSAGEIGHMLMKKPKIRTAIDAAKAVRSEATRIDAAFLLTHLAEMLKADYGDIIDPDTGEYRPLHDWPKIWRQMLTGAEVEELFEYDRDAKERVNTGRVKKIKFVDRLRVIELLGRHIDIQAFQVPNETHLHEHSHTHVFGQMSLSELHAKNVELNQRIRDQMARLPAHHADIEIEAVRSTKAPK